MAQFIFDNNGLSAVCAVLTMPSSLRRERLASKKEAVEEGPGENKGASRTTVMLSSK